MIANAGGGAEMMCIFYDLEHEGRIYWLFMAFGAPSEMGLHPASGGQDRRIPSPHNPELLIGVHEVANRMITEAGEVPINWNLVARTVERGYESKADILRRAAILWFPATTRLSLKDDLVGMQRSACTPESGDFNLFVGARLDAKSYSTLSPVWLLDAENAVMAQSLLLNKVGGEFAIRIERCCPVLPLGDIISPNQPAP